MSKTYKVTYECENCGNQIERHCNALDNNLPETLLLNMGMAAEEKLWGDCEKSIEGYICKECEGSSLPIKCKEI